MKAKPSLPMASRMQMAASTGNSMKKQGSGNPIAKRLIKSAKGKGMAGRDSYR
jgi:hypothetical protein